MAPITPRVQTELAYYGDAVIVYTHAALLHLLPYRCKSADCKALSGYHRPSLRLRRWYLVMSMKKRMSLSMVACFILTITSRASTQEAWFIVRVDSAIGDDSTCHSLQELRAARLNDSMDDRANDTINATVSPPNPCRTLNRALGNIDCYNSCVYNEVNKDPLVDVVVYLMDGVHRLSDCISIDGGQNVTIEAVNYGQAIVNCAYFPENVDMKRDGVRACRTEGLTFKGVRFENCGQHSPAVFLNRTSSVVLEDCVFA